MDDVLEPAVVGDELELVLALHRLEPGRILELHRLFALLAALVQQKKMRIYWERIYIVVEV